MARIDPKGKGIAAAVSSSSDSDDELPLVHRVRLREIAEARGGNKGIAIQDPQEKVAAPQPSPQPKVIIYLTFFLASFLAFLLQY